MKIIVLHGDDTTKSRKRLNTFTKVAKKRKWDIIRIEDNSDLSLAENLTSGSLFNVERLYILENFNRLSPKDIQWLKKKSANFTGRLVIFHQKMIAKTKINNLPKPLTVEEYQIPKIIFKYIDSFFPGNGKMCLHLFHQALENEPVEFIFSLLAKQVRDMYWVKIGSSKIPYPSWRVLKLERQASKFEDIQLKRLITTLSKLDIEAKTSKTDLAKSLDLLVFSELQ